MLDVANGGFFASNSSAFGPAVLLLDGGTLGAITSMTIANQLDIVDGQEDFGILNFGGKSNLALSGSLYLGPGPVGVNYYINDPNGIGTLAGQISGTGTVNFSGSPTLSGNNIYAGRPRSAPAPMLRSPTTWPSARRSSRSTTAGSRRALP